MKLLKYTLLLIALLVFSRIIAQPDAPQNLKATSSTYEIGGVTVSIVTLDWDAVKDSKGNAIALYEIFRKDGDVKSSNSFESIGQVLWANKKFDEDVVNGNTYSYYVVAKDGENKVSASSNIVDVTVGNDPIGGSNSSVSGHVEDANTQSSLEGVYVTLISTSSLVSKTEMTDASGNYSIDILPGEYIVYFRAPQDYHHQYYNNVNHVWDATRINLLDGETLSDINAELVPFENANEFILSGNVSDENSAPVDAIISVMYNGPYYFNFKKHFARTDENGDYSISLKEGSEVILFAQPESSQLYGEFYDNSMSLAGAEKIVINSDISGIDFILESKPGGTGAISGTVSNSENEAVEAMILAIKLGSARGDRLSNIRAFTDDEGNYNLEELLAGEYILFALPEQGYKPTFYKADGSQTTKWREADILTVDENSNLSGISFVLSEIPEITDNGISELAGLVKDENNAPLSDALISVYDENEALINYSYSNENGEYSINGLQPGFYKVSCSDYGLSYEENSNVYVGIETEANSNFVLTPDVIVGVNDINVPVEYYLEQNYPNPFNPSTTINFAIEKQGEVELKVYDILGSEITTLVSNELASGNYQINFDASELPSGIYIYQLKTNNFIQSRRMMLLK